MEPIIQFYRACPAALPPMRADESALGTLPTVAFQYCEAVRVASSFGWYVFPPADFVLSWDGIDVRYATEDGWELLRSIHLDDESVAYWDDHAPEDLKGYAPPVLSHLLVPGVVQIWSGLFVATAEDWSIFVRSPANFPQSKSFVCFDGLVETDRFKPCPLFINIRLTSTDTEIFIPHDKPLFQVQPIHRQCYDDQALRTPALIEFGAGDDGTPGMSVTDWDGIRGTLRRIDDPDAARRSGKYGAAVRRRSKRGD